GRRPDAAHEGRRAPMTVFEKKGWYRLTLPEGWEADEDESPVAIYHPEGAGALQLTAETPRPLPPGGKIDVFLMLRAFLKQTGVDFIEEAAIRTTERGLDRAFYEICAELCLALMLSLKAYSHMVYVVISFALLGYGLGSNLYLLLKERLAGNSWEDLTAVLLLLISAMVVMCAQILPYVPLKLGMIY